MSQEFNKLEKSVLNWFKQTYNHPQLSRQIDSATLARRNWTKVGFYVDLDVSRDLKPIDLKDLGGHWPINGPFIRSDEVDNLALTVLWGKNGYIDCIEMCSYGFFFNEHVQNFELEARFER